MKKVIGLMLSLTLVICATVTVNAGNINGGALGSPSTGTVAVSASVPDEWSFTIPASVEMAADPDADVAENGSRLYTASFDVTVKGGIASTHYVKLTLGNLVLKTSESDPGVTANITGDKTSWSREDCYANDNKGTTASYAVKANLTPGSYSGVINYTFELKDVGSGN